MGNRCPTRKEKILKIYKEIFLPYYKGNYDFLREISKDVVFDFNLRKTKEFFEGDVERVLYEKGLDNCERTKERIYEMLRADLSIIFDREFGKKALLKLRRKLSKKTSL